MDEPHEVLGVSRDADEDEIEEAYREKTKKYHPDVCDREDATEIFMRVKEAYEVLISGNAGTVGGKSGGSEPGRTSNGSAEGKSSARTSDRQRGSEEYKQSDEGGSEVFGSYGDGWKLARGGKGVGWYVFSEAETAPYVDGKVFTYLKGTGETSSNPVYFDSKREAREAYKKYAETDQGDSENGTEGRSGGSSGSEKSTGAYVHRSKEKRDSFDKEGIRWGGTRKGAYLDRLWRLCYQEGRTENGGDAVRRWGATTDVVGDRRFINSDGEYQTTEFWFETEKEAKEAYDSYIREMRQARSKGTRKTAGEDGRDSTSSGRVYGDRHYLVEFAYQMASSAVGNLPEDAQKRVRGAVEEIRPSVVSFLYFVTFERVSKAVKNIMKAFLAVYVVLFIDLAWGPRLSDSVFTGEGASPLTQGPMLFLAQFALIFLLLSVLLNERDQ
jgi:hypothetical protein